VSSAAELQNGPKKCPNPSLVQKIAVEKNLSSAGGSQILKKMWVQPAELKFLKAIGVWSAEPLFIVQLD